jgi:hypothetical protein
MELEEIRRRAGRALADLGPPPERGLSRKSERHHLCYNEFPVPELILFALTRLRDFISFGPEEKLRWGVNASFRDTEFSLSLEKFGLQLYVPEGTPSDTRLALVRCLQVAANLAEACLRDLAQDQAERGNVTIENRYHQFEGAYRFFRDRASQAYDAPPPEPVVTHRDDNGRPTGWHNEPWKPQIEGGYLAGAMMEAYFSRLEHALVLVLPFTDFEPGGGVLLRFVGATWDAKWRTIFDINADPGAKRTYDQLGRIKETVRNPISHGGFGKKGTSFFFHVDGIGALPALLTRHGRPLEFLVTRVPHNTYQELCQQLDACDAFLQESKIRAGLRYAQSGLDVAFSVDFRHLCRTASQSDETLEEFIEYRAHVDEI